MAGTLGARAGRSAPRPARARPHVIQAFSSQLDNDPYFGFEMYVSENISRFTKIFTGVRRPLSDLFIFVTHIDYLT